MRLSRSLLPTLRDAPADAQIVSHRLMLRAGLVRQTAAGIYAWLPAGWRVLHNIAEIVRQEQDAVGAQELLMPTLQGAELWRQSGRYDAYGPEMLRLKDRHERDMLYGPTNEEMITDLMRQSVHSYRELPQILYHIQWKFRDEIRPRFGVMRGREFLMKDGYSFDLDHAGAVVSYRRMMLSYMRTFARLGVQAIPMRAETGPIGGDLSHEFIILAPTGESQVYYDAAFEEMDYGTGHFDAQDPASLERFFEAVTTPYAATDDMHDPEAWARLDPARKREGRGIEVGHIFYFGTKYSAALNFHVAGPAAVLNLKQGDAKCDAACEQLYAALGNAGLYDDRAERAGVKFADADLMGHPWQLIVGPRGAAAGTVELKRRATGERTEVSAESALARVLASQVLA